MDDYRIRDEAQLRSIYGEPLPTALAKEVDSIHPLYRPLIEASPFAVLATRGPQGIDTSPRGDGPGFIEIADEKTLLLPDRRGNNRIDSLRNVIACPEVALLFLIPGVCESLRVRGRATLSIAPNLLERFTVQGKAPRCVIVIEVESVFFQCARALMRSQLWNPENHRDRSTLPTAGQILETLSQAAIDGVSYDRELPVRQRETLY